MITRLNVINLILGARCDHGISNARTVPFMLMMYHLLHELDTSAIYSFKETKELGVFGERFQILSNQKLENIAFIIILITYCVI